MVSHHKRNLLSGSLPPGPSLYLDLLRFCAAAEVFAHHLIMLTGKPWTMPAIIVAVAATENQRHLLLRFGNRKLVDKSQ